MLLLIFGKMLPWGRCTNGVNNWEIAKRDSTVNVGGSSPWRLCCKTFAINYIWELNTDNTDVRKLRHHRNKCSRHDVLAMSTNQMISSGRLKLTTTRDAMAFEFWIDSFQTSVLLRRDVLDKTFDRRLMRILVSRIGEILSPQ